MSESSPKTSAPVPVAPTVATPGTGTTAAPAPVLATESSPAPASAPAEKPTPRKFARASRAETVAAAPAPAPTPVSSKTEKTSKVEVPEKGSRILARLRSQIEADRASVEEAKSYREELSQYARGALEGLPKEARAYIEKIAGENPAKQLATLRELRAAGLLSAPAPAAPANTAPRAPAPANAKPGDDDASVLAEYERLRKVAPVIALDYETRNRDAIKRARTARN